MPPQVEVGTHLGGMEYIGSRSARGPDESNRNMSKPPIMVSVVPLRLMSAASGGDESTGGDGPGCDGGGASPVGPGENSSDSPKPSGSLPGSSRCLAYSDGEYSLMWSRDCVVVVREAPKDCRLPMATPAGGCQWETGICWL